MRTLEDVRRAADLAASRETLTSLIERARETPIQSAFGVSLSYSLIEHLRHIVVSHQQSLLSETETALRDLGVLLPGDPVTGLVPPDTAPVGGLDRPRSWDPARGTFEVLVPGYQGLSPRGLRGGPLCDTDVVSEGGARCGKVVGYGTSLDGMLLRIMIDADQGRVRRDLDEGLIRRVEVGIQVVEEPRGGTDTKWWWVSSVCLVRGRDKGEPAFDALAGLDRP